MQRLRVFLAALVALSSSALVRADAVLVFEETGADGTKTQQRLSISGPWIRVDQGTERGPSYTLMDTSRQLRFEVDAPGRRFSVTRTGRLFWPSAPPDPELKPGSEMGTVAGVRCRMVIETVGGTPVAEHCMTAGGPLRLSERELTSLSRLFAGGRRMGLNPLLVATPDERQVAIQSRRLADGARIELRSVQVGITARGDMLLPPDYQRLTPERTGLPSGADVTPSAEGPSDTATPENGAASGTPGPDGGGEPTQASPPAAAPTPAPPGASSPRVSPE
jgi:hypothetical protein